MDADLDSHVPNDIITSSDKLGEENEPLTTGPPGGWVAEQSLFGMTCWSMYGLH